jgi:hypothetical protein
MPALICEILFVWSDLGGIKQTKADRKFRSATLRVVSFLQIAKQLIVADYQNQLAGNSF